VYRAPPDELVSESILREHTLGVVSAAWSTLETAVPLLATAAFSIGIGFGASAMYASAELHHPLVAPGTAYYALTTAGIVAALAILVGTFPLLARITGPEVARNE
jgi:hypothetical protein